MKIRLCRSTPLSCLLLVCCVAALKVPAVLAEGENHWFGAPRAASSTLSVTNVIWSANLDVDPGWTRTGEWAFGRPTGGGGGTYGHPDPTSGATGTNVFGINLSGNYSTAIDSGYYLVAGPVNCSGFAALTLSFQRWLNSDYPPYVYQTIEFSTNATDWVGVWTNGAMTDSAWTQVSYALPSLADHASSLYVRWGHRVGSSAAYAYSGWNIDDIVLLGTVAESLQIQPSDGLSSAGYQGGPFTPTNKVYSLLNTAASNVTWSVTCPQNWVTATPTGGTLASGATTNVSVLVNSTASSLANGDYTAVVTFSNQVSGVSQTRAVTLSVATPPLPPSQPFGPLPENGASVVHMDTDLSWNNASLQNSTSLPAQANPAQLKSISGGGPMLVVQTSGSISGSIRAILDSLGQPYDFVQTTDFSTLSLSSYATVIIGMEGGEISYGGMSSLGTAVRAGAKLILFGGSSCQTFASGLNNFFISDYTNNIYWSTVSGQPNLSVTNLSHPLAAGLPSTYSFVDSAASCYMARITDPSVTIVARNGDGYPCLCTKTLGAGSMIYFINAPTDTFWSDPSDFNVLRTVLLNALAFNGLAANYNVYFGTNPAALPQIASNLTDTVCHPGMLAFNTTYYWQVIASNVSGIATGAVWSFTTALDELQCSSPTYSVLENGGFASIMVTRLNTASTVSVNFAATNGVATPYVDYAPTNGTLVFGPGVAAQTFLVPILDDSVVEPSESVQLTLSAPSPNVYLGTNASALLTILDDDGTIVFLPYNLYDGTSYLWDVQQNGSIGNGSIDAYDGGLVMQGFPYLATALLSGQELTLGPTNMAGVEYTRRIYAPMDAGYARYMEIVHNVGAGTVTVPVTIYSDLGSDSSTVLVGTSSGDTIFGTNDNWIVTDDTDATGDPTLLHVIGNDYGLVRPSSTMYTVGSLQYTWQLTLAPGETRIVMHFASQNFNQAAALAKGPVLADLGLNALSGISDADRMRIVNFGYPDPLRIMPMDDLSSTGYVGGPFVPSGKTYNLLNLGSSNLAWSATSTQSWVMLSGDAGTLLSGADTNITVSFSAAAASLPAGTYSATVVFSNVLSGFAQVRNLTLQVAALPGEIEVYDSIPPANDTNMPFGQIIVGLSRTEQLIVSNSDPVHPLVINNISMGKYEENFDDGLAQDWHADIDAHWSVIAGTYRAYDPVPGYSESMVATYAGKEFGNFSYEISMRCDESTGSPHYMLFRASPDFETYPVSTGSAYGFGVTTGSFYIFKQVNGVLTTLVSWTSSSYINPTTTWNVLKIVAIGSNLQFFINGHLVQTLTDTSLVSGRIGLLGYTGSSSVTHQYFDNITAGDPETVALGITPEQAWYNAHPCAVEAGPEAPPKDWHPQAYAGPETIGADPNNTLGAVSAGGFTVTNLPAFPYTLSPGASIAVTVIYQPQELVSNNATIAIKSNDADEPVVTVGLSGQGIADYMVVTPGAEFDSSGHPGGPFVPANAVYQVTNLGPVPIQWTGFHAQNWLSIAPAGGTLNPGASTNVTVAFTVNAASLPQGVHTDTIVFSNTVSGMTANRSVSLSVFTSAEIWVDPLSMSVTNAVNGSTLRTLTIGNSGDAPLQFTVRSRQTSYTPAAPSGVVETRAQDNHMVLEYDFEKPTIGSRGAYDSIISSSGQQEHRQTGAPVVPVRPATIVIPYGKAISAIRVTPLRERKLEGSYRLPPAQPPFPLSHPEMARAVPPDAAIYGKAGSWPGKTHEQFDVQSKRGYQLLHLKLFPVQYTPLSGEIQYAERMRVEIDLIDAAAPGKLRPSDRTEQWIARRVDNPQSLAQYPASSQSVHPLGAPGTLPAGGPYDYVIITTPALAAAPGPWNFQAIRDARTAQGLKATIVTTDWIYANYSGTRPSGGSDNQTQIRNFLIDAYQTWGTHYALLGGNASLIPPRLFWVDSHSGEIDQMPVDMYYGCVEPAACTFDGDADGVYGEPTDGVGGGDVDLEAEIYIGRATVVNASDLANFVHKVVTYDQTTSAYLPRITMVGEYLGFGGISDYAAGSMEQIRLGGTYDGYFTYGFENHPQVDFCDFNTATNLYDTETYTWSPSDLIALMNKGTHVFNHLGHANATYVMKLSTSDLSSLTNSDAFFIYSQGCEPGWFDAPNCFAELVTRMTNGAFGAVMNARFGWGSSDSTDGPSQRFGRQYWDAVLGEDMLELGRANQDSKEDNLWDINGSCIRWCYYELNLFGDPAQQFRFRESVSWIDTVPITGTVPPGGSTNIQVEFLGTGLSPGLYSADVMVESNDKDTPTTNVPCLMLLSPDDLSIGPASDFSSTGPHGGPFVPESKSYTLTNTGASSLTWQAGLAQSWVTCSPSGGTLQPGAAVSVLLQINSNALSFASGNYAALATFTNMTSGGTFFRQVLLCVIPNTVRFGAPSFSVSESAAQIQIPAVREGSTTGTVTVDYYTVPGTALDGADYMATNGTLVFADGVTNASLYVHIINDTQSEAPETFSVVMTNPAAGILLTNPSNTTVTIIDDDAVRISMFYDPLYVDTSSSIAGEATNVMAALLAKGCQIQTFVGISAASFSNALATAQILYIPELEVGSPGPLLSPEAKSCISNFVSNGGGLIINGTSANNDEVFVNNVFGYNLPAGGYGGTIMITASATNTAFAGGPGTLANNNGTYFWTKSSLPPTAWSVYEDILGQQTAVALITQGFGKIVFLAYDWYDAYPRGSQNGGWDDVLGRAVIEASTPALMPPQIDANPADQTVCVGGTATFSVTAHGIGSLYYQWRRYGTNIAGATHSVLKIPSAQPSDAGDHAYTVMITNLQGFAISSGASLTVVPPISLAEALDTHTWTWTTGGQAAWTGQSAITHDGVDAAQSAELADSQESWLETTFSNCPGTLSFWWKASSEADYDFLELYRNGVLQTNRISGEVDWQFMSMPIPSGIQVVRWRYSKDGAFFGGQDRAWLDQVSFIPAPAPQLRMSASCAKDGSMTVMIGNSDGSWISLEQLALIRVCTTTNLALPLAQWTWITNALVCSSNGCAQFLGFKAGADPCRYFLGYLSPPAPTILTQPSDLVVSSGDSACFTVMASGVAPISYQWRKNGMNIEGCTGSTLILPHVSVADVADYAVMITNISGAVCSSKAHLTVLASGATVFANPEMISISAFGPASSYPSFILVSGLAGTVTKATVTVSNLSHAFPDDLDILLVGPNGWNVLLMSDAGGAGDLADVTLTFDDAAAEPLPDDTQLYSGLYRPTDYPPSELLPAPAPAGSYGSSLAVFNGTDPNGVWKLFVYDDSDGDAGVVGNGWSLRIAVAVQPPPVLLQPTLNGNLLFVNFETLAGRNYTLEYKNTLSDASWQPFLTVVGTGTTKTIANSITGIPHRYFRLKLE